MKTTIARKDYDSLTTEQRKLIDSLGLVVEDKEKERENDNLFFTPSSKERKQSVLENYCCVIETDCKLCQSRATKVFKMTGTGGLLTSTESSLEQVEGLTVKTRYEATFTCPCCHDVLKLMSQEDLIALTIRIAKGGIITKKKL